MNRQQMYFFFSLFLAVIYSLTPSSASGQAIYDATATMTIGYKVSLITNEGEFQYGEDEKTDQIIREYVTVSGDTSPGSGEIISKGDASSSIYAGGTLVDSSSAKTVVELEKKLEVLQKEKIIEEVLIKEKVEELEKKIIIPDIPQKVVEKLPPKQTLLNPEGKIELDVFTSGQADFGITASFIEQFGFIAFDIQDDVDDTKYFFNIYLDVAWAFDAAKQVDDPATEDAWSIALGSLYYFDSIKALLAEDTPNDKLFSFLLESGQDSDIFSLGYRLAEGEQMGLWGNVIARGAAEANPVPEPSTFFLLGGGLAGLAFYARRRRKE